MKIKRFNQINEADTNQIPDTQLHKYFVLYKRWCDENGKEYNFKKTSIDNIVKIAKKYAKEHNVPNMFYYKDI